MGHARGLVVMLAVLTLGPTTPALAHPGSGDGEATPVAVTDDGLLVHVDPVPEGKRPAPVPPPEESAVVPLRHSQPAAATRVYLDFDGHTYSGSQWTGTSGTRTISPYAGTTAQIDEVWRRVAEDFAAFDVDITTEEPVPADLAGPGDGRYGVRVVVGGTPGQAGFGSGTAGVAPWAGQSGTFSMNLTPGAFAFANVFPNDLEFIADTISHETGHVFGAAHDGTGPDCTPCETTQSYYTGHGTGPTSWGPIMGSPQSGQVTTWSDGTYPNANNTEDDLTLISRWMGLRPDDAPDGVDVQDAATLGGTPGAVDQEGLITARGDTDLFRFSAAGGPITLIVTPRAPGANLDAKLELRDATGGLVASADDPEGLSATLATTVAAGTYLLRVDGVGDADPAPGYDDYASLGHYRIQGSYPDPAGLAPGVVVTPGPRVLGAGPLTVEFDSAATSPGQGTITERRWSFGDGTTSTAVAPSHTYAADGTYTARFTVSNSAGYVAGRDITVVVDSVAPDTVITGGPPASAPFGSRTVTFTYRDQPATGDADFVCALDDAAPATCPAAGRTYEDVEDGEHTFTVRARDEAGNVDPTPASRSFFVDGPPLRPELTTSPVSPGNDTTPLLRGLADPGTTVAVFTTADCSGDVLGTATAAELFDGLPVTVPANSASTFSVQAFDDDGLESPCGSLTYVEDSLDPDTAITAGPTAGSTTASASATFTYVADPADGDTFSCALDGGAAAVCPATGVTYPGLAEGPHTFTVAAVDRAGNADASPAVRTWSVAPPAEPTPEPGGDPSPSPSPAPTPAPSPTPGPVGTPAPGDGGAAPPSPLPVAGPPIAPVLDAPIVRPPARVRRLAVRVDRAARTATLTFRVPAGARAVCSVNRKPFRTCRSPLRLRGLKPGRHEVRVRSTVGTQRGATVNKTFQMPRRR